MIKGRINWTEQALEEVASGTQRLSVRAPTNPLFLHPVWLRTWRRHFGTDVRTGALVLDSPTDGSAIAIAPLMRSQHVRGPAMSVRFDIYPGDERFMMQPPRYRFFPVNQISPPLAMESGDLRSGIAFERCTLAAGVKALVDALVAEGGWDVGVFPVADADFSMWKHSLDQSGLRAYVLPEMRSFFFRERMCSWDGFLDLAGAHRRKRARQAVKHLSRDGFRLEIWSGPDRVEEGMQALAMLADKSWKQNGRGGESVVVPYTERGRAFYEELCLTGGEELTPVYCVLLDDHDSPRAVMASIVCGETLVPLLTFYDPAIARMGPGLFLMKGLFDFYESKSGHSFTRIDFNATHQWVIPYQDRTEVYHLFLLLSPRLYGRLLELIIKSATRAYVPLTDFAAWRNQNKQTCAPARKEQPHAFDS